MKKIIVIVLMLSLTLVGFCSCGNNDDIEGNVNVNVIDENSEMSMDAIKINGITIEQHKENNDDTYYNVLVNITNQLGYDCDDVSVKLKLLDENNNIIDNVEPFLYNVDSEQSGNAEISIDDSHLLDNLKAVEICGYSAWEKDNNEGVEGKYSKKQIVNIEDIVVETVQ